MASPDHPLQHIAIVMDGNRRWATERGKPPLVGHTEGKDTLRRIADAVAKRDIPFLTVWALSTENLNGRTPQELAHIFALMEQLPRYINDFKKNKTRINLIGDLSPLPKKTQQRILDAVEKTKQFTKSTLTFAINYGGRDEIVRAVKKIITTGLPTKDITEKLFNQFLDTADLPEVDLMIRTGGRMRLSGWLPWQTTYAELYFTETNWPAFSVEELDTAIAWFCEQQRNRGK